MKKNKSGEWIEQAMQSLDRIERAAPQPFLLTRLQANLNDRSAVQNNWNYRIAAFISRPAIAIATVILVIGLNGGIIALHNKSKSGKNEQTLNYSRDEYAINATSIYDIENQEP